MSNATQAAGVSIGSGMNFSSVLLLIFITLKLTHVIHWSWWWVLSPIWIGIGITAAVFVVATIIFAIVGAFAAKLR